MGNCHEMVRGEAPEASRIVSGSLRQGVDLVCPSVGKNGGGGCCLPVLKTVIKPNNISLLVSKLRVNFLEQF